MRTRGNKYKATEQEQREITQRFLTTDVSRAELAEEYKVSISTIDNYVRRFRKEYEQKMTAGG